MDREGVYSFASSLGGAGCDYPFKDDFFTFAMRHKGSGKWFGLCLQAPVRSLLRGADGDKAAALLRFFGEEERVTVVNLKCDPALSIILQQSYAGVLPAYHMNKRAWISVPLESDVPDGELKKLITLSYDLTSDGGRD